MTEVPFTNWRAHQRPHPSRVVVTLGRGVGGRVTMHDVAEYRKGYESRAAAALEAAELSDAVQVLLKSLTHREREVIKLRYGIGDGFTYTLEEVGRIFRVTRERVRAIQNKALRKMQHPTRLDCLRGHQ